MMTVINGPQVTAQLSAGLKDIARLTGFSEKMVTKGEAGAILKTWAGRTKVAKPAMVDYRARKRAIHSIGFTKASELGNITINTGTRALAGRMWVKTAGKRGKGWKMAGRLDPQTFQFTPNNYHWKTGDWIDIKEAAIDAELAIKRETEVGRLSAGLARQSVVQIADKLGINLLKIPGGGISPAGIAKARLAMASNGQRYINGTASETEEKDAGRYFVTMVNSLPYHAKAGLDRTLAGVLAGRVGLYRRTFANGAFKSVKSAARNYPWMRTYLAA
jgi:hypothetical protein